jgi:hypothetical protein
MYNPALEQNRVRHDNCAPWGVPRKSSAARTIGERRKNYSGERIIRM